MYQERGGSFTVRVQAKTTKKVVLRLECTVCKYKMQLAIKRCKQYVPWGIASPFVRVNRVSTASSSVVRRRPRVKLFNSYVTLTIDARFL